MAECQENDSKRSQTKKKKKKKKKKPKRDTILKVPVHRAEGVEWTRGVGAESLFSSLIPLTLSPRGTYQVAWSGIPDGVHQKRISNFLRFLLLAKVEATHRSA